MKTGIKDIDDLLKGGMTINEFTCFAGSLELDTKKSTKKELIESINTAIDEHKAKCPNGPTEIILDSMIKIEKKEEA